MLLFCFRIQTGLGIAIMLIGFELLTFLMGITMFMPSAAMICILSHCKRRKQYNMMWLKVVVQSWRCYMHSKIKQVKQLWKEMKLQS
jgi:hypothetical protein